MFVNPNPAKNCNKFFCKKCDFSTVRKSSYEEHLLTLKHQKSMFVNPNPANPAKTCSDHICQFCQKSYKDNSGLWRHKKKCEFLKEKKEIINNTQNDFTPELIKLITDLVKSQNGMQESIIELCKNGTNNTNSNNTTNNSHNKSFNLQLFLNETCKNAMNITDFVDSLQLQLSDLEKVGDVGYIEGISNIIIKNLNALDITDRPIHCTDKKRETMYIKNEDKWEKEDENKSKLHKMVRRISNKNIDLISEFKELHPDWKKSNSRVSDQFNKIVIESMGGAGDNDFEKEEKIIKRVAKEVLINKGGSQDL
jgi:hypothetical protein